MSSPEHLTAQNDQVPSQSPSVENIATSSREQLAPEQSADNSAKQSWLCDWLSGCGRRWRPDAKIVRLMIVILTPLLLLPMPIVVPTPEMKTAYALILMAIYWTTESLPLAITALIPTFIFPLLGVVKSKDVAKCYMKESIMLFLGGFFVAAAIEKHNLHRRVALKVLLIIGTSLPRLMAGVMAVTAFLSMWISNTATTTMMIPIVEAVLQQLRSHMVGDQEPSEEEAKEAIQLMDGHPAVEIPLEESHEKKVNQVESLESVDSHVVVIRKPRGDGDGDGEGKVSKEHFANMCKAMSLSVAYSATCGGSATLIGTGVIVLAKNFVDSYFEERGAESGMTFTTWMLFSLPITIFGLFLCWFWLQLFWIGFGNTFKALKCGGAGSKSAEQGVYNIIKAEYKTLGPISFAEIMIVVHFVLLALLWFFRDPGMFPGWASFFRDGYVGAMVPAMFIGSLLFVVPGSNPFEKGWKYEPLLDMPTMVQKMPFGIILLLGGGMALALACQESGLSVWLGGKMSVLSAVPTWILVGIISLFLSLFTEFTSNVAVISIVMPILAELALAINVNPMQLIMPGTVACTFAFMLPVATPPNAIVFSYGHLRIIDMVKSGFLMNVLCIMIVTVAGNTWGKAVFGYGELPPELSSVPLPTAANTTADYILR